MNLKGLFIFLFTFLFLVEGIAQGVYAPLNPDYYWKIDRYEILSSKNFPNTHTSQKPYLRKEIAEFGDSSGLDQTSFSRSDEFNFSYFLADNHEWADTEHEDSKKALVKALYKKKSDLLYFKDKDFEVHVNPVFEFAGGRDFGPDSLLGLNTRGVELRGSIDGRVGFYSYITDTQARLPDYLLPYANRVYPDSNYALVHEGFWKDFNKGGYDFFSPRGYVTFGITKHIGLQFGFDRNFIGNGYRSLILSDFGNAYTFLKFNTKVWKIHYTNIFAQMTARYTGINERYDRKFMALHHFSLNLGRNVNIGISETVFFGGKSDFQEPTFEISYLNPIIFYRALEHQLGSPDNVSIAMDFKWNFLNHFSLYGQVMFDEFLLEEIRAQNGWWANKYAFQLGGKYVNVGGVSNLDLQLEANVVRPFTYTHIDDYRSYTHYNQPLAHPLGANFSEFIGILRYQPIPRLEIRAKGIFAQKGLDVDRVDNNGGDIMKSYRTRNQEYGNTLGQGQATNINYVDFTFSYMLKHNLFIDFQQVFRDSDSQFSPYTFSNTYSLITLRLNKQKRTWEF